MKLRMRKVRTDNGPWWSHVGYELVANNGRPIQHISVDGAPHWGVFWLSYWSKPIKPATYRNFEQRYFRREVSIQEFPIENISVPVGDAFPYPGIHNPGSGYIQSEDYAEVPISMVTPWKEITSQEARCNGLRHSEEAYGKMFERRAL